MKIVKDYAYYRGYKWDYKNKIFTKPSFSETLDHLTIDQMYDNLTRAQIQDRFYEKNKTNER